MKKQLKKGMLTLGLIASLSIMGSLSAYAGEWQQDEYGFWMYNTHDDYYYCDAWELIDGQWYYFDSNGYMVCNAWIRNNKYWFHTGETGAIEVNKTYGDGYLNETGKWKNNHLIYTNPSIMPERERDYWNGLWAKYGITDESFINQGDGSYVFTCVLDCNAVIPELHLALNQKLIEISENTEYNFHADRKYVEDFITVRYTCYDIVRDEPASEEEFHKQLDANTMADIKAVWEAGEMTEAELRENIDTLLYYTSQEEKDAFFNSLVAAKAS